jgi:hypothetical protein
MRQDVKIITRLALIAVTAFVSASLTFFPQEAQRKGGFSHNTPAHKTGKYADCSVCHQLPTANWRSARPDKLAPFPDVVMYPNPHNKANPAASVCFVCHKNTGFDNVSFCGACHAMSSKSIVGIKGVLPFPTISHGQQFLTKFPHDKHQDLIAETQPAEQRPVHFIRATFPLPDDKAKSAFYNCAICHKTTEQLPKYAAIRPMLFKALADPVADSFSKPITAKFFKNSPEGHESCFNCHYQFANLPSKQGCASCHAPAPQPYFEKRVTERYSLKFDHNSSGHMGGDCAACHIRITQNADIRTMKDADVPISSCTRCHATQEDDKDKQALIIELDARAASIKDKKPVFQCTYCHTSAVGRYEVPPSHLVAQ